MIASKTQKAKSDKETIIDMEPINDEHNKNVYKNLNFIIPLIFFLLFLLTLSWLIFHYLPNFFQEQASRTNQLINNIADINDRENNQIKNLDKEIEKLKYNLKNINISANDEVFLEIKNIKESNLLLREDIQKVKNKLATIQKNYKHNYIKNIEPTKQSYQNKDLNEVAKNSINTKNIEKSESSIILEAKKIIKILLAKKDFGSVHTKQKTLSETGYLDKLKNHFAGFFKLRQFSNNSTPRGIITKAEIELKNGNLDGFIYLIKTLPESWKQPIKEFIIKFENNLLKISEKRE